MPVQAISSVQTRPTPKTAKNSNPVKTGAKIGAAIGLGNCVASAAIFAATFKKSPQLKNNFEAGVKLMGTSKYIAATIAGVTLGISALVGLGAGIGAIVKACQNKNTDKA